MYPTHSIHYDISVTQPGLFIFTPALSQLHMDISGKFIHHRIGFPSVKN